MQVAMCAGTRSNLDFHTHTCKHAHTSGCVIYTIVQQLSQHYQPGCRHPASVLPLRVMNPMCLSPGMHK